MNCPVCSRPTNRVLDLVKDGTVYKAFRCPNGHHQVSDTRQTQLPVDLESRDGVHLARVSCDDNCFIFDRRMFRSALRQVFRACRSGSGHLVLDLSRVGLVGDGLLSAIRFLEAGLSRRNRSCAVIAPSAAVESHLLQAVPRLDGRVFRFEADAVAAVAGGPALAAAALGE